MQHNHPATTAQPLARAFTAPTSITYMCQPTIGQSPRSFQLKRLLVIARYRSAVQVYAFERWRPTLLPLAKFLNGCAPHDNSINQGTQGVASASHASIASIGRHASIASIGRHASIASPPSIARNSQLHSIACTQRSQLHSEGWSIPNI